MRHPRSFIPPTFPSNSLSTQDCLHSVYAVSDLHTDYAENLAWVDRLCSRRHLRDVLLVAGDVSDTLPLFQQTMATLALKFGLVFFVPGNHDLWLRRDGSEGKDSLRKLWRIERACEAAGVKTTPQRVRMCGGSVSICPLLSFYHESFDTEPAISRLRLPSVARVMADYRACHWPPPLRMGSEDLARLFDRINERQLARSAAQAENNAWLTPLRSWDDAHGEGAALLSFSHFLPRIELIPEKRFLFYPDLMKAVGSAPLGARLKSLRPHAHVFGHTHFGWDGEVEGVRYIQAPLGTPKERRQRMRTLAIGEMTRGPLEVYDGRRRSGPAGLVARRHAVWSDYYRTTEREPTTVEPAPWVLKHYLARAPRRVVGS
ncbi:hypothetical protein AB1Y20_013439 [Prymnesium parvum]|uniref:Calcineurin-like phosphoesterase domain-containing protein n=1 Tax=Prymnesium parvum TaxID=97485 RepID=A0AB34IIQ6_PRYPA